MGEPFDVVRADPIDANRSGKVSAGTHSPGQGDPRRGGAQMRTPRFARGRVLARRRLPVLDWPDPPMVPSIALRQIERAETIEDVRAIVHRYLPERKRVEDAA